VAPLAFVVETVPSLEILGTASFVRGEEVPFSYWHSLHTETTPNRSFSVDELSAILWQVAIRTQQNNYSLAIAEVAVFGTPLSGW